VLPLIFDQPDASHPVVVDRGARCLPPKLERAASERLRGWASIAMGDSKPDGDTNQHCHPTSDNRPIPGTEIFFPEIGANDEGKR
jgi:hypothetical protein